MVNSGINVFVDIIKFQGGDQGFSIKITFKHLNLKRKNFLNNTKKGNDCLMLTPED